MKITSVLGRILTLVIAAAALALVSCGQNPKEEYGYVYEDARISLNDGENIIDWGAGTAASSWDRGMVVFTSSGLGVFGIRSVDGSVNIVFNDGGRRYYTFDNAAAAPDGGYVCTAKAWSSANGEKYDRIRISPDGELSVIDTSGFDAGDIMSIAVSGGGTLYLYVDDGYEGKIIVYDDKMTLSNTLDMPSDHVRAKNTKTAYLSRGADDTVLLFYRTRDSENQLAWGEIRLDDKSGELSEPITLPQGTNTPLIAPRHDFYSKNLMGLSAADITGGEARSELLFAWSDLGLISDYIRNIVVRSEEQMFIRHIDTLTGEIVYGVINRVPASFFDGMRDIVIAYDTDTPVADIRQMTHYAARFNRENTDSRVRFRGYTSAGLSAAALIAKDISAGNAPDIILFSDVMPYTMFSGSDTLADLYLFIDADPELGREDFIPAAVEPFSDNGKLCALTLSFSLRTLITREESGAVPGQSVARFIDTVENNGGALTALPPDADMKLQFLERLVPAVISEYIDKDAKECDFSGFGEILELIGNADIADANGTDIRDYTNGRVLFNSADITTIGEFIAAKYMVFGGKPVFAGYPNAGTMALASFQLAVTGSGGDPEGAWSFIKACVGYQKDKISAIKNQVDIVFLKGFPCTYDALDILFDKMSEWYVLLYTNEKKDAKTGQEIEVAVSSYIGKTYTDAEGNVNEMEKRDDYFDVTEEDIAELRELISGCHVSTGCDDAVLSIILEEASAYFSGVRNIDDTLKFITDRVNTRIHE